MWIETCLILQKHLGQRKVHGWSLTRFYFTLRPCAASCVGMLRSTLKPKGTALCLFWPAICWWQPMRRTKTGRKYLSKWEPRKHSKPKYFMLNNGLFLKCNFRCTLKILLGKESGWTVLTARTLLTTSRLPLGQRCPLRACCCRLTLAALLEISAQVGFILTHRPVEQKNCCCSSPAHWATLWGSFCSVCRQQPSSLNPWWGWQSDGIAYSWGETQPWRWRADYAKVWKLPIWMWRMPNVSNPTNPTWNSLRSSLGLNILF